jgi:hypothetical protein
VALSTWPAIRIDPDLAPGAAPSFHQPVRWIEGGTASTPWGNVDPDRRHRRVDPEGHDPHAGRRALSR